MSIWLRVSAVLLVAALAGCAPSSDKQSDSKTQPPPGADATVETPAPNDSTVHPMGFGPVRAGMTRAEAEQALGAPLTLLGPRMEPCHYVVDARHPGVAFMVIDGRIARVDVQPNGTVKTAEGVGVGDTEALVQSLYLGVEVQPHKYVDGHYLIVRPAAPADSGFRLIFETDGKRVTSYRAGRMPEVRWVEGCS